MANQILKAISGIATANSAPRDSMRVVLPGVYNGPGARAAHLIERLRRAAATLIAIILVSA